MSSFGRIDPARPESPDAMVRLGLGYLMGKDVPADPARGVALIEQAALADDARGAWLAATISSCSFWRPVNWNVALDHLLRAASLGHEPARSSLRILAIGPDGREIEDEDWASMRAAVDLAAWFAPPRVTPISEAPRIRIIEQFAPPAACDWLIAQARNGLARATIYDKGTGGHTEDYRRTNSECTLDIESLGVLTFVLRGRIAAITGRHDLAMEVPKVLHYAPGQFFAEHFDYLDPSEPAYAAQLAQRGQRTDTFLLYLNDDYSGGETRFPRLDLAHKGARGDGFLFANVDAAGAPDPLTMHVGAPPTSGEKWVFSQWIRAFPKG